MPKPENKILRFLRLVYLKIFRINDAPQKVAIGFSLGVFCGIIPGMGPLASLTLALLFRVNRAAALFGSILTNTWLSLVTFMLALKIGAGVFKVNWHDLQDEWFFFMDNFHWGNIFKASLIKLILPVITGYVIIGLCSAFIAYVLAFIIISAKRKVSRKYGK